MELWRVWCASPKTIRCAPGWRTPAPAGSPTLSQPVPKRSTTSDMAEDDQPAPPLVYFDADVIVSGCRSASGASRVLLRLAEYGLIRAITSELALEEAERHIRTVSP